MLSRRGQLPQVRGRLGNRVNQAPTPEAQARTAASVPLRRMGSPDDVAAACLFLGSDAARYVSGAILPADGGWMLNGAPMNLGGV